MATANVTNKLMESELLPLDKYDALSAKLAMLCANLHVISGAGFDVFNDLSDEIRQNYIWGCSTIAEECRAIMARNSEG